VGVASLYGVEREGEQAYLVWEYVDGATWEEHVGGGQMPEKAPAALRRELKAAVESLHALGIVHGALHERNVLVRPDGRVILTHISPLLYNDPEVDRDAVRELLERLGEDESAAPASDAGVQAAEPSEDRRARKWALLGAFLTAAAGALIAWAIWKWVGHGAGEQAGNTAVVGCLWAKGCICTSDTLWR
jgi:hypothetical protein